MFGVLRDIEKNSYRVGALEDPNEHATVSDMNPQLTTKQSIQKLDSLFASHCGRLKVG